MIIEILFAVSITAYLTYIYNEKAKSDFETDLLTSFNIIASSLKENNSFETAITKISKGKDRASGFFKEILAKIKQGSTLSEAFRDYEKKSSTLFALSKLVESYEESGQDISPELRELYSRSMELRSIEKNFYAKTYSDLMLIQFLSILVVPLVTLFAAGLLQVDLYAYTSYYMLFSVFVFGFLDYFVYSDIKKALYVLPVYLISYFLVISSIAPYLISLFIR
jgi:hypothetical protein